MTKIELVTDGEALLRAHQAVKDVYVDRLVHEYIVDLSRATREHADLYLRADPLGSLALFRGGQAVGAIRGRDYVVPDDVKDLAIAALSHHIIVSPAAEIRSADTRSIVQEILDTVPVPGATAA